MPKGYIKYVDEVCPEIAKQFLHYEESHVGLQSQKETQFVCKCCSRIFTDKIANVTRRRSVTCIACRDGISYPEKFVCNMLDQLHISFILHYYSDWTNGYYYDFEFIYNNKKYIIETDGGLGHGHNGFKNSDIQKTILIDAEKDKLAIDNGYNIIRIDCNYLNNLDGRYEYIKENIIKSLSYLFDLEKVDFDKCNEYALGSLFYEVIKFYKEESKYINDICKKFHLKKTCVCKYLKHAMKINLLPNEYLHDYDIFKNFPVPVIRAYKNEEARNFKILYCYDDAIAFDSASALANYLNINPHSISTLIKNNNGKIFGKTYCYYKDLPEDFDYNPIKSQRIRNKQLYQYTKDKTKLINVYENKLYLPSEFDYSHVIQVCNGKRKSHKGFWWSYSNIFEE